MKFSLILATIGRTEELGRFLDSLNAQTYRDFELVIVDQNEDGRLDGVIRPYAGLMQIKHLRSAPGLSHARNIGLRHVTGQYVAFPDDDCVYPSDLLLRVHEWLGRNRNYAFLSGQYVDFDVTRVHFPAKPQDISSLSVFSKLSSITVFFLAGAVSGLTFDERLGSGTELPSAEEHDFALKVMRKGCKGRYEPSFFLHHNVYRPAMQAPNFWKLREKAKSYVLLKNAIRGMKLFWPYLLLRFVRDLCLYPFSARAKCKFGARMGGYLMAVKGARV